MVFLQRRHLLCPSCGWEFTPEDQVNIIQNMVPEMQRESMKSWLWEVYLDKFEAQNLLCNLEQND